MTSSEKDISAESQTPEGCSIGEEFGNWIKRAKEKKSQKPQEDEIESSHAMEDELVKAEAQEDIGGEFSLFPCCKQCETPEKLFAHIKRHHEKDATKCVLCGKELSSKSSLDRHLLIHAKWQPYKCNHCNKQFSTNGNMHRHKKTHKGVCKGSKFVKEEQKVSKESSPLKKAKRGTLHKYDYDVRLRAPVTAVHFNGFKDTIGVCSEKRKGNVGEASENEQSVKKMKSSCKDNTEMIRNEIAEKTETSDTRTYPLSPDSQSDINEPPDDSPLKILNNIPRFPSKEEFITTLGLKTACRSIGASNNQSDNSIGVSQPNRDEHFDPESVDDVMKRVQIEALLKFHASARLPVIEQSDPPSKEMNHVPEVNENNITNNKDRHWLPESPETSTEGSCENLLKSCGENKEDDIKPQHLCQYCKKEFKSKIIFLKHLTKHRKQKYFKCTICGAKLPSKQSATRHVMKIHKKRKLQARSLIVEDLDDVSSASTKTQCEWCGEEFTASLILEHHKRAYKGCQAKPFICLICKKSFSTKNNGKRHQFKYHKDVQDDCCIARNVIPNKNEDIDSQPKEIDSSTSTCSIAVDDVPQESSVESPLSSESEHPDESELSLPKKELDAAQSLIDMFSSFPPHQSSRDEGISDQPVINSCPPTQDNSCFYYPMPIPVNVQSKPLDLSVHPMDLSSKSNESADRLSASCEFRRLAYPFTFPISPEGKSRDTGIFHVDKLNSIPLESPLNLVKKKEHNFSNHFHSLLQSPVSLASNLFESKNHSPIEVNDLSQKECNSPKSPVLYECNLCSMSFSTNSNKRRHEKTKHLMHCKGPQNSKLSLGFFNAGEKQVTSTPKSVLSKKTKEALITKVSSLKPSDFEPVDFSVHSDSGLNQPLAMISNESENGDLASVSSLISTANSPQLKKYLTADNVCDVAANPVEAATDVKVEQESPKVVDQTLASTKGSNKHWCSVCQKQFTCKSSFNRHSVIHTKKRDHHCQECKKTFTTKSNRDRHIKKVHRLILSRDNKKLTPSKKQQKKSIPIVPSESSTVEMDIKDLTLPKVNSEISQCNKENQRLFMPS